jgi:hypothetical protein
MGNAGGILAENRRAKIAGIGQFAEREKEPLDPEGVGVLGPDAVVQVWGRLADLIEEPGYVRNRPRESPENRRQPVVSRAGV